MKTKQIIKSITIHTNQEKKKYECNDFLISKIEDWSQEYPDHMNNIFIGFDKLGNKLFELINLSVEVCYSTISVEDVSHG